MAVENDIQRGWYGLPVGRGEPQVGWCWDEEIEGRFRVGRVGCVADLLDSACNRRAGAEVLEAFVYVNQDGNSTNFTGLRVTCDGQPHASNVTVTASGFLLHRGAASASGYLLLTSGESASPTQRLRLR